MANKHASSTDVREVVTGDNVGRNIASDVTPVHREHVTGNGFGKDTFADVYPGTAREVITGDGVGKTTFADVLPGNVREVVTGDGVGMLWYGGVAGAWREAIIKQAPFAMASTVREVIVQLPGEPLTQHQMVGNMRMTVVMHHTAGTPPAQARSYDYVPQLRENVIMAADRNWARSDDFAKTLRHQTIMRRFFVDTPHVISSNYVANMRHITVLSRNKTYIPVSAIYTKQLQVKVVQHRNTTTAANTRSPIYTFTQRMLVVMSRAAPVIVKQPGYVATEAQLVVMERDPTQHNIGYDNAKQLCEIVVQHRTPGVTPQPHSFEYVQTERMIVVQRREVAPPNATADRYAKHFGMTAIQHRGDMSVITRSYITVGQQRVQYVLAADYPAPPDVMGPEDGVFMQQYAQKIVQHRVTESPNVYGHSVYTYQVAQRLVVPDEFPDKDLAYSQIDVLSLTSRAVVGDAFPDPTIPVSVADVYSLTMKPVVTDVYPDPTIPLSEAQVRVAAQVPVVADMTLPDPTLPQSVLDTRVVAELPVVADLSFADPLTVYGPVTALALAQVAVTPDPQMMRIPARVNRRRPVVTVTIS